MHKASVTACLRALGDGRLRRQEVRTFGTATRELWRLADWLTAAGCTHIAMESTGVYWRPIYNLLEGSFELAVGSSIVLGGSESKSNVFGGQDYRMPRGGSARSDLPSGIDNRLAEF